MKEYERQLWVRNAHPDQLHGYKNKFPWEAVFIIVGILLFTLTIIFVVIKQTENDAKCASKYGAGSTWSGANICNTTGRPMETSI